LYTTYHSDGLELLAFPANQFGGQAPGTSEEERAWAIKKFGFDFPVMDKIAVLNKPTPQWEGPTEMSPVYAFLKNALPGEIPWNYSALPLPRGVMSPKNAGMLTRDFLHISQVPGGPGRRAAAALRPG
jgi:glutathione peroxidase-family protein